MVFVGFIFMFWSIGLIMMLIDDNKRKKRENVGLPKLENFSSAPMPKCKPIKRPQSQFKDSKDNESNQLKYLKSRLENAYNDKNLNEYQRLSLIHWLNENINMIEKDVVVVDREKIKEYAEILEQIEDLEGLVKAYESDTRTDWIASTKIRSRYGNTTSYEFDISRKESKERFLEWVKNEIKMLEELLK